MLTTLSQEERLLLLKFVCAFAWADLRVQDAERNFVRRLVRRFKLSPVEMEEVEAWLQLAPAPHEVDPALIPRAHRRAFIEAARAVIYADGHVDPEERAQLDRLQAALSD